MARVTVEDCVVKVPNRFDLVLLASQRAREISAGAKEIVERDHNATTPVEPGVFAAMEPYFREEWGNPSSSYRFGSKLKGALETAREQVAELIGAHPLEIIFTSGGTESDNTALHAILRADLTKRHIVTSAVEHSAVLSFCRGLEAMGFRITRLPVDREPGIP